MSTAGRNLRWQWRLANGGIVDAIIDNERKLELVTQRTKILSEAPRGGRPEGHTVTIEPEFREGRSERPPIEALVTFAPNAPICILRVDGHEVAPSTWPTRSKRVPSLPPPATRQWATYGLLAALGGAALLALGLFASTRIASSAERATGKLDTSYRAPNGRFIAHFPGELRPRPAILPSSVGGVVLEDKEKSVTIVIAALAREGERDPWTIQQRLRDEALANVPKGAARFEETTRREETCAGERGAVVAGHLMEQGTRRARAWACAFFHDDAAYLTLYTIAEPVGSADERRVRAIADATELTHLADLGSSAPNPLLLPSH